MRKFIAKKESPFSEDCHTELHHFVTKQVMTDEIRKYICGASEEGKKRYEVFHFEIIINKITQLKDTIHISNQNHDLHQMQTPKESKESNQIHVYYT